MTRTTVFLLISKSSSLLSAETAAWLWKCNINMQIQSFTAVNLQQWLHTYTLLMINLREQIKILSHPFRTSKQWTSTPSKDHGLSLQVHVCMSANINQWRTQRSQHYIPICGIMSNRGFDIYVNSWLVCSLAQGWRKHHVQFSCNWHLNKI